MSTDLERIRQIDRFAKEWSRLQAEDFIRFSQYAKLGEWHKIPEPQRSALRQLMETEAKQSPLSYLRPPEIWTSMGGTSSSSPTDDSGFTYSPTPRSEDLDSEKVGLLRKVFGGLWFLGDLNWKFMFGSWTEYLPEYLYQLRVNGFDVKEALKKVLETLKKDIDRSKYLAFHAGILEPLTEHVAKLYTAFSRNVIGGLLYLPAFITKGGRGFDEWSERLIQMSRPMYSRYTGLGAVMSELVDVVWGDRTAVDYVRLPIREKDASGKWGEVRYEIVPAHLVEAIKDHTRYGNLEIVLPQGVSLDSYKEAQRIPSLVYRAYNWNPIYTTFEILGLLLDPTMYGGFGVVGAFKYAKNMERAYKLFKSSKTLGGKYVAASQMAAMTNALPLVVPYALLGKTFRWISRMPVVEPMVLKTGSTLGRVLSRHAKQIEVGALRLGNFAERFAKAFPSYYFPEEAVYYGFPTERVGNWLRHVERQTGGFWSSFWRKEEAITQSRDAIRDTMNAVDKLRRVYAGEREIRFTSRELEQLKRLEVPKELVDAIQGGMREGFEAIKQRHALTVSRLVADYLTIPEVAERLLLTKLNWFGSIVRGLYRGVVALNEATDRIGKRYPFLWKWFDSRTAIAEDAGRMSRNIEGALWEKNMELVNSINTVGTPQFEDSLVYKLNDELNRQMGVIFDRVMSRGYTSEAALAEVEATFKKYEQTIDRLTRILGRSPQDDTWFVFMEEFSRRFWREFGYLEDDFKRTGRLTDEAVAQMRAFISRWERPQTGETRIPEWSLLFGGRVVKEERMSKSFFEDLFEAVGDLNAALETMWGYGFNAVPKDFHLLLWSIRRMGLTTSTIRNLVEMHTELLEEAKRIKQLGGNGDEFLKTMRSMVLRVLSNTPFEEQEMKVFRQILEEQGIPEDKIRFYENSLMENAFGVGVMKRVEIPTIEAEDLFIQESRRLADEVAMYKSSREDEIVQALRQQGCL